jgi:hypothetical protein
MGGRIRRRLEVEADGGVVDQDVVLAVAVNVGDVLELVDDLVFGHDGLDVDVVRDGEDALVDPGDLWDADFGYAEAVLLDV